MKEMQNPSGRAKGEFLKMNFMIPASIAMTYGLQGVNTVSSFGCAAGATTIGEAYRCVKHGYMDAMISGGADYSANEVGLNIMDNLEQLTHEYNDRPGEAVKPFDKKRSGTVLGDGGAFVLLESLESAEKRGAKIYCEIVGYNSNCHASDHLLPNERGEETFYTLQ